MTSSAAAQRYWDDNAASLTFSHPAALEWLAELPKTARLLDFGCGYGRLLADLAAAGWRNGIGVDFSRGMVERGRAEHPDFDLRHVDGLRLAEPDGAFDAVFLFAVLTTIPDIAHQDAVMAELRRVLKPGGLLYVSDYGLQTDDRYLARYRDGEARHGHYGVWDRGDGGVFRHHTEARLGELLSGFEGVCERQLPTRTLSGASAVATQLLARRLAD